MAGKLTFVSILLSILLTVGCGRSMEQQAREQVRVLGGAALEKEAVQVANGKVSGDLATADVTIHTAVKLRKVGDNWVIEEVRLGDRHWEKVDRILEALEAARTDATRNEMKAVVEGIQRYREVRGSVPVAASYEALIDVLSPEFLGSVIRLDAWQNPFSLDQEDGTFQIRSAGPDGRLGTADDLVVTA